MRKSPTFKRPTFKLEVLLPPKRIPSARDIELHDSIEMALECLTSEEEQVVRLHYGMISSSDGTAIDPQNFYDIAANLGIGRRTGHKVVSKIHVRAMEKLRIHAHWLREDMVAPMCTQPYHTPVRLKERSYFRASGLGKMPRKLLGAHGGPKPNLPYRTI